MLFNLSLAYHQLPRQGDNFQSFIPDAAGACEMLLRVTADDVIAGRVFIHHAKEHFLDTRAFLVDGIIQRVDQVFHTLNDLLLVHHLCRCHIITCKFLTIICQTFELDTLRMCQEQQIHSLMHRLQLHLLLIVFQDETIILRNNQAAKGLSYPLPATGSRVFSPPVPVPLVSAAHSFCYFLHDIIQPRFPSAHRRRLSHHHLFFRWRRLWFRHIFHLWLLHSRLWLGGWCHLKR